MEKTVPSIAVDKILSVIFREPNESGFSYYMVERNQTEKMGIGYVRHFVGYHPIVVFSKHTSSDSHIIDK